LQKPQLDKGYFFSFAAEKGQLKIKNRKIKN
jgi:hypothetical protein